MARPSPPKIAILTCAFDRGQFLRACPWKYAIHRIAAIAADVLAGRAAASATTKEVVVATAAAATSTAAPEEMATPAAMVLRHVHVRFVLLPFQHVR